MICPKCNREIQFYYLDVELYCPLCLCSLRGNSPEVIRVKQAKLYLRPKNYVPDEHIISHILDPIKASKQRYDQEKRVRPDRKSTRLNSSHITISYAVFCLKKKKKITDKKNSKVNAQMISPF